MWPIAIGALIGGLIFTYWEFFLAMLVIGCLLMAGQWLIEMPERHEVVSNMEFNQVITQVDEYEWAIAYRVANNSSSHEIRDMYFTCDGGVKSQSTMKPMKPGMTYTGMLRIPFAENVKNCTPHFELNKAN